MHSKQIFILKKIFVDFSKFIFNQNQLRIFCLIKNIDTFLIHPINKQKKRILSIWVNIKLDIFGWKETKKIIKYFQKKFFKYQEQSNTNIPRLEPLSINYLLSHPSQRWEIHFGLFFEHTNLHIFPIWPIFRIFYIFFPIFIFLNLKIREKKFYQYGNFGTSAKSI